jgi:hypothetical protein
VLHGPCISRHLFPSRQERRRGLQSTRQPAGVKVVQAVRLPRHPPACYTLLPSRVSSSNATSCRQNATRPNSGPSELCKRRAFRNVLLPPMLLLYLIPLSGTTPKDHATMRSLAALIASLPASDSQGFRDEFETVPILLSRSRSFLTNDS